MQQQPVQFEKVEHSVLSNSTSNSAIPKHAASKNATSNSAISHRATLIQCNITKVQREIVQCQNSATSHSATLK